MPIELTSRTFRTSVGRCVALVWTPCVAAEASPVCQPGLCYCRGRFLIIPVMALMRSESDHLSSGGAVGTAILATVRPVSSRGLATVGLSRCA